MKTNIMPDGKPFVWGRVLNEICIGEREDGFPVITVVEYNPKRPGQRPAPGAYDEDRIEYHTYLGNKDTNRGATSLESALLQALCHLKRPTAQDADETARVLARVLGVEF